MCNPAAIAMTFISLMSTAAQQQQQREVVRAQQDAATNAAIADQQALQEQQQQQNAQIRLDQFERMKQGMREQATLAVALGEANVSGVTPMRELSNVMEQADYDMSIMESNRQNYEKQNTRNQQKVNTTAQGRVNTAEASLGTSWSNGLQIVAAGAQGAAAGFQLGEAFSGQRKPTVDTIQ